jgi:PAS domain-containing protein
LTNSSFLQDTQEESRTWLEKSPVCTKILDPEFNLHYMSSAGVNALKISDINPYYVTPFPFEFYPNAAREGIIGDLEKAARDKEVVTYERPVVDINGDEVWFHTTIVPMADNSGAIEYLIVISIDINERKQLEEELRKSHALFSQAEQMGKIGHWEWDVADDRLCGCSEQYAAIFEMSIAEAMGADANAASWRKLDTDDAFSKDLADYVHEEDLDRYTQVTEAAYTQKIPWQIEFRIRTQTGKIAHVLELGEPVLDEDGTLIRTFGTMQDITQGKLAEEKLNYQASHDDLTGLINRREFERRAERLLVNMEQHPAEHAMCFIDLDQFKVVNDTCGHTAGDELLRQLSSVLTTTVRHRDTLARLGGG